MTTTASRPALLERLAALDVAAGVNRSGSARATARRLALIVDAHGHPRLGQDLARAADTSYDNLAAAARNVARAIGGCECACHLTAERKADHECRPASSPGDLLVVDEAPAPVRTPVRSFRVADETWLAAVELTAARGETVTAVLVDALERYLEQHGTEGATA